jgi:hypothetical protein
VAWLTYAYQFGAGGLVFLVGLFVIVRAGSCQLSNRSDRVWFIFLIVGYFWLALIYLLWILAAIHL